MRSVAILSGILFVLPGALAAQQQAPPEIVRDDRLAVLEQRVRALEDELSLLKEALKAARAPMVAQIRESQAAPPRLLLASAAARVAEAEATPPAAGLSSTPEPVANAAQAQAGPLPIYGGASAAAKALNPDISVIGDFLGAIGRNRVRPVPGLELHESEVGLQAIIDPYARGDFFISFGESGVNLEEGYITFTALPAGIVAKVGKMRSAFGKVNMMHNHVLPWVDRPLVTTNLVGGEDGIDDAGVSVERILPAPKGIFLEATGQVFCGDSGSGDELVFQSH